MGFMSEAYERYKSAGLVELQDLVRRRGGNLRRKKCRRLCIKMLGLLDKQHQEDLAAAFSVPYVRPEPPSLLRGDAREKHLKDRDARYTCCTQKALQDFIMQRTGDPSRNRDRATCLRELEFLDANQKFRFLDLIPEIRNMIYEMLLTTHNETWKIDPWTERIDFKNLFTRSFACSPLLRVNKQINAEATGYLYDGVVSYCATYQYLPPRVTLRDYPEARSVLPEPSSLPTTRYLVRNLTILLMHWCAAEVQMEEVVALHTATGPLKSLKVVLNEHCIEHVRQSVQAMEKLFLPLAGKLAKTDVQLVGFSELLREVARRTIAGEAISGQEDATEPITDL